MRTKEIKLLEIIILLLIFVILLSVTISGVVDFTNKAKKATEDATLRTIRRSVTMYAAESIIQGRSPLYPPVLDEAPNSSFSSEQNHFFTTLLGSSGLTLKGWYKLNEYTYRGPSGKIYIYNRETGDLSE